MFTLSPKVYISTCALCFIPDSMLTLFPTVGLYWSILSMVYVLLEYFNYHKLFNYTNTLRTLRDHPASYWGLGMYILQKIIIV